MGIRTPKGPHVEQYRRHRRAMLLATLGLSAAGSLFVLVLGGWTAPLRDLAASVMAVALVPLAAALFEALSFSRQQAADLDEQECSYRDSRKRHPTLVGHAVDDDRTNP